MTIDEHGLPQTLADLSPTRDHHGAPDSTLQRMADWADRSGHGLSLSLTLVVSGGLICGVVESAREFFSSISQELLQDVAGQGDQYEEVVKRLAQLFFDDTAQALGDELKAELDALERGETLTPGTGLSRTLMGRYLYLKDAQFTAPGYESIPLGHTRVLLSQVAAWSVSARANPPIRDRN
jgi:hypothetical protein